MSRRRQRVCLLVDVSVRNRPIVLGRFRLFAFVVGARRGTTLHLGLDFDHFAGLRMFVMLVDLGVTGLPQILFCMTSLNQKQNQLCLKNTFVVKHSAKPS